MALADRRPIPITAAHAAPVFNDVDLKYEDKFAEDKFDKFDKLFELGESTTPGPDKADDEYGDTDFELAPKAPSEKDLSPTQMSPGTPGRSISPDSLVAAKKSLSVSLREATPFFGKKKASRVPIATGISTTIPVTGEKPKPAQEGDASLEDDVLFAIFLILYEKDPVGQGMTVKQICDVLVERHPDMAQLSSKTLNLVSAKLNAYVKRVEKGDPQLKYALSREWADASPKRMVYVYRGLLAKDFHVHVPKVEEAPPKPRRQTMFDLGRPEALCVPYSLAPVTANIDSQRELDDLDFDLDDEPFLDVEFRSKRLMLMLALPLKKAKLLTAAAAAPRVPKTPCSHSPHAAAAAAALHAAALKAIAAAGPALGMELAEVRAPEEMRLLDLDQFFS